MRYRNSNQTVVLKIDDAQTDMSYCPAKLKADLEQRLGFGASEIRGVLGEATRTGGTTCSFLGCPSFVPNRNEDYEFVKMVNALKRVC